ncbi:MAG: CotH kinase family protein [Verrucomicrobia bacterium]|nr:CotH kinase family protein [Verrucomicrobiota bacterium]MCH8511794.1 CotH kinase family protein [Kiritimatiellia bacterium]
MRWMIHILLLLMMFSPSVALAQVRMNEIMSVNACTLADEDGDFEDWIELKNISELPVSLEGWGISDNESNPFKWTFPGGTIMPGEHLLVFASGKDRGLQNHSPEAIEGLVFWLDASELAPGDLVYPDDPDEPPRVERWSNRVTGMPALETETPNQRPEWHEEVFNGQPGIRFDGQEQWLGALDVSLFNQSQGASVVVVMIPHVLTPAQHIFSLSNGNSFNQSRMLLRLAQGRTEAGGRRLDNQNYAPIQGPVPVVGEPLLFSATADHRYNRLRLHTRGMLRGERSPFRGTGTYSNTNSLGVGIGGNANGTNLFQGHVLEVLAFNRPLAGAELLQVEAYLAQKYGLRYDSLGHTNFSISSTGEEVVLTNPEGARIDRVAPHPIPVDMSLGRDPEHPESWVYFTAPTPLAENEGEHFSGIAPLPIFSHSPGFYPQSFSLEMHVEGAPEGAQIIYSMDGHQPSADLTDGGTLFYKNDYPEGELLSLPLLSVEYTTPVEITPRTPEANLLSKIATHRSLGIYPPEPQNNTRKAQIIRAQTHVPGMLPSPVVTATYFVGEAFAEGYSLPVLSVVSDPRNFFDYEQGIYVPGKIYNDWRLANPDADTSSFNPANYTQTGYVSERPSHVELFEPDFNPILSQRVGARMHGGNKRALTGKAFRFYAGRGPFSTNTFGDELFPGVLRRGEFIEEPVESRRVIFTHLGRPSSGTLVRDPVLQDLVKHMGFDTQASRRAVHFVNGEYWGIGEFRERYDANYFEIHHGIPEQDLIMLEHMRQIGHGTHEDLKDFEDFVDLLGELDLSDPQVFSMVTAAFDLDNYLSYQIAQIFMCNRDWPHNNVRLYRRRNGSDELASIYGKEHDGRWRMLMFDVEVGGTQPGYNMLEHATVSQGTHYFRRLFTHLLEIDEVRHRFLSLTDDHLNTSFVPERFEDTILRIYGETQPELAEHAERWLDDGGGPANFLSFAQQRPAFLRQHYESFFDLPGSQTLALLNPGYPMGKIRVNTVTIDEETLGLSDPSSPYPWTGDYFKSVPLDLQALPKPGHRFVGWVVHSTNAAEPAEAESEYFSTEPVIALTLSEDTTVEAVFEPIPLSEQPVALYVWDFEDPNDPFAPSIPIGGAALGFSPGPHAESAAISNTGADFETRHLRVNYPLGAVLTFPVPTTGYEQIALDLLTRRSGQGAGMQTLSYTIDGINWTVVETYSVHNDLPQSLSFDFSSNPDVADNPDFAIRFTFGRTQSQIDNEEGLAGNNRFDDVVLSGVALPGTNLPPVVDEDAVPVWLGLNFEEIRNFDLSEWFEDPDGDELSFSASVSNASVLTVEVEGSDLGLTALAAGDTRVTVTASDGVNPPVETEFRVLVYPEPHVLDGAHYFFTEWSADEPAGTFPPHMIFLQSEVNDPNANEILPRAYSIAGDAASGDDPDFPYAASARSRINGLGEDGISFINTGRGRDVGAALLVLDTRNVSNIDVVWTAQTLLANSRVYALRLQARTSADAEWEDLLDEGSPVVYFRDPDEGPEIVLGPVRLPSDYEGLETLHLQWRYHHVSGTSGPRAMLRLDDVAVTSSGAPLEPAALQISGLSPYLSGGDLPVLTVRVVDENGILVGDFDGNVSLSIHGADPVTVQAVDGVAFFEGLTVSSVGLIGITATADGLTPDTREVRRLRLVDLLVPPFLQGEQDLFGDNLNRIPVAFRFRIEGLDPDGTYRYGNRMAHDPTDPEADDNGAGNFILIPADGGDWVRSTSAPRFRDTDLNSRHAELTADAEGVWEGWGITEPSGNARFAPGNALRPLLILNDGAGGEDPAWFLRSDGSVTVLELGPGEGQGTALYGQTSNASARFVALYDVSDNLLALTHVEARGSEFDDRYADFYLDTVAAHPGRWGTLIPNNLAVGVDRIEVLDADGAALEILDTGLDGTIHADGGTQAVWLPASTEFIFLPGGDGRWNDPNHWMAPGFPNGASVSAIVPAPFWDNRAITLPESFSATVGTLTFTNGDHRNRIDGAGNLSFDGDGGSAQVVVTDAGAGFAEFDLEGTVNLVTSLTIDTQSVEDDPFAPEFGSLRLRGEWAGAGGLTKTGTGVASLTGGGKDFTGDLLIAEGVLRVTDPATPGQVAGVSVQPGGQLRLVSTGENRIYDFGVPLQLAGSGRNPDDVPEGDQRGILGALRFDPFANDNEAVVPGGVILAGDISVSLHVDGTRNTLDLSGPLSGTADFSKTGGGTLRLSGSVAIPLESVVANGTLRVDGEYPAMSVTVETDGVLSGTGTFHTASGAGTLELGPGEVLTAQSVSGMSYRFRLQSGTPPPILRLQADPPFTGGFNAANSFALYLDQQPPAHPRFGFFSDAAADLAGLTSAGTWSVYMQDQDGNDTLLPDTPTLFTAHHTFDGVDGTLLGAAVGPASYTDWAAANFEFGAEDGPTDNPFGTGPNLLNYALGLPAGVLPGVNEILLGITENGHLFARFRRDPTLSDVIYIVETTDDLQNWDDVEILYDSSEDLQPNNDFDRMWIEDDTQGDPLRFLRLRMILDAAE